MTGRKSRDQKKVGNCVVAERASPKYLYNGRSHRVRDIERLIARRHGRLLPAEYLPAFLEVVGSCHRDRSATLEWVKRYAPEAVDRFDEIFEPIGREIAQRRWNLNHENAGRQVRLTSIERSELKICTMWASDISVDDQRKKASDRKRQNDRNRNAEKRRAKGRKTRSEYLAEHSHQPWEDQGISRSTFDRRKKRERDEGPSRKAQSDDEGPSQHTQWQLDESPSHVRHADDEGLSPTENTHRVFDMGTGDTPVSPIDRTSRIGARPKRRPAHQGAGLGAQLDLFADGGTT